MAAAIARQVSPWSVRPHDCLPLLCAPGPEGVAHVGSADAGCQLTYGPSGWLAAAPSGLVHVSNQALVFKLPALYAGDAAWVHCSTAYGGRALSACVLDGILRLCMHSIDQETSTILEEKLSGSASTESCALSLSCSGDGALQLLLRSGKGLCLYQWHMQQIEGSILLSSANHWDLHPQGWTFDSLGASGRVHLQALVAGFSLLLLQREGGQPTVCVTRQPLQSDTHADCVLSAPVDSRFFSAMSAAAGGAHCSIEALGVDWSLGKLHVAVRHCQHRQSVLDVSFCQRPVFKQSLLPVQGDPGAAVVASTCALLAAAAQHSQLALIFGSADLAAMDTVHTFGQPHSLSFPGSLTSRLSPASPQQLSPAAGGQAAAPRSPSVAAVPDSALDSRAGMLHAGKEFNGGQRGYAGPPWALMGCEVGVLWAGQQWFEGTVTRFDPGSGRHFVQYRDGDERWYSISEKTFRVLSVPALTADEQARLRKVADDALAAARAMAATSNSSANKTSDTTASESSSLLVWDGETQVRLLGSVTAGGAALLSEQADASVLACVAEANAAFATYESAESVEIGEWEPLALDLRSGCGASDAALHLATVACAALRSSGGLEAQAKHDCGAFEWISCLSTTSKQAVLAQACSILVCHGAAAEHVFPHQFQPEGIVGSGAATSGEAKASMDDTFPPELTGAFEELSDLLHGDVSGLFDSGMLDAQCAEFRDSAVKFAALATTENPSRHIAAFNAACMLASMHEAPTELSLRWLRLAAVLGYTSSASARTDDDFDPIRDHVGFDMVLDFMDRLGQARSAAGIAADAKLHLSSTEHVLTWAPHIPLDTAWESCQEPSTVFRTDSWLQELQVLVLQTVHVCSGAGGSIPDVTSSLSAAPQDLRNVRYLAESRDIPNRYKFMVDTVAYLQLHDSDSAASAELVSLLLLDLQAFLDSSTKHCIEQSVGDSRQESMVLGVTFYVLESAPAAAAAVLPGIMNLRHAQLGTVAGLLVKSTESKNLLQSLWTELVSHSMGAPATPHVQQDGLEQKSPELSSAAAPGSPSKVLAELLQRLQSHVLRIPDTSLEGVLPLLVNNADWLKDSLWYVGMVLRLLSPGDCCSTLDCQGVAFLLSQTLRFYHDEILPAAASLTGEAYSRATAGVFTHLSQIAPKLLGRVSLSHPASSIRAEMLRCSVTTMQFANVPAMSPLEVQSCPPHASLNELQKLARVDKASQQSLLAVRALVQLPPSSAPASEMAASAASKRVLALVASRGVRAPLLPASMAKVHDIAFMGAFCAAAHFCLPSTVLASAAVQRLLSADAPDTATATDALGEPDVDAIAPVAKLALESAAWAVSGWKAGRVLHELALWVYSLEHVAVDTPFEAVMQFAATEQVDSSRLQDFCTMLFTDALPASLPEGLREAISSCGKSALRTFLGVTAAQHAASEEAGLVAALLAPAAAEPAASTASQAQIEAHISFALRCITATLRHWVWAVNHADSLKESTACPAEMFACAQLLDRSQVLLQCQSPAKPCSPSMIIGFLCSSAIPAWQAALTGAPSELCDPERLLQIALQRSLKEVRCASNLDFGMDLIASCSDAGSGDSAAGADIRSQQLSAVIWQAVSQLAHADVDETVLNQQLAPGVLLSALHDLFLSSKQAGKHRGNSAALRLALVLCSSIPLALPQEEFWQPLLLAVRNMQTWLVELGADLSSLSEETRPYWNSLQAPVSGQALLHHTMAAAVQAENALLLALTGKAPEAVLSCSAAHCAQLLAPVMASEELASPKVGQLREFVGAECKEEEVSTGMAESKHSGVADEGTASQIDASGALAADVACSWRTVEGLLFRGLCSALLCKHTALSAGSRFSDACVRLDESGQEAVKGLCSLAARLLGSGSFQLPNKTWTSASSKPTSSVMSGAHPLLTPRVAQALLVFIRGVCSEGAAGLMDSAGTMTAQLLRCTEFCVTAHNSNRGYTCAMESPVATDALSIFRAFERTLADDDTIVADCGPFNAAPTHVIHSEVKHSAAWPVVSMRTSDLGQRGVGLRSVAVPVLNQAAEQLCTEVASSFVSSPNKDKPNQNTPSELRRRLVAASAGIAGSGRSAAMREALMGLLGAGPAVNDSHGSSEPNAFEALSHSLNMYSALWGKFLNGHSVPLHETSAAGLTVQTQLCVALSCSAVQSTSRAQGVTASVVKPQMTPAVVWEATNTARHAVLASLEVGSPDGGFRSFHAVLRSGERRCLAVVELDSTALGAKPSVRQQRGVGSVLLPSALALARSLVSCPKPLLQTAWRSTTLDSSVADSSALISALDSIQGVDLDFASVLEPGKVGVAMSEAQALAAVTSSPLLPGRVPQRTPAQRMRLAIDTELRRVLLEKLRAQFGPESGIATAPSRSAGQDALAQMLGLGRDSSQNDSEDVGGFLRNVPASLSGILGAIAHGSRPPAPRQAPSRPPPEPTAPASASAAGQADAADVFEELARDSFALDGETLVAESHEDGARPAANAVAQRSLLLDSVMPGGSKQDPAHALRVFLPTTFKRSRSNVKQFVDLAWTAVRRSDFPHETLDALRSSLLRQIEEQESAIVARGPLSLCTSAAHHLAAAGVHTSLTPMPARGTAREAFEMNDSQVSPGATYSVVPGLHQGPSAAILGSLSADAVVALASVDTQVLSDVVTAFDEGKSEAVRHAAALCLGGRLGVLGPLEVGQIARVLPYELDISVPPQLCMSDGRAGWTDGDGMYHKVWVPPQQAVSALDGALVRVLSRSSAWGGNGVLVQVLHWGMCDPEARETFAEVFELTPERLAAVSSHAAASIERVRGAVSGQLQPASLLHAGSLNVWTGSSLLAKVLSVALRDLRHAAQATSSALACACLLVCQLGMAASHGGTVEAAARTWAKANEAELTLALSPLLVGQAASWAASVPVLSGQVPAALAAATSWHATSVVAGIGQAEQQSNSATAAKITGGATSPQVPDVSVLQQLPTDIDADSLFCSFAIQAPQGQAAAGLPIWGVPRRFSSAVRFAGFRQGAQDPRRRGKGGFRASEQVVFPANCAWPDTAEWASLRFGYFEATIVHSERSSGQSSPAVRIGLWADTSLSRGTGHGREWGPGSVVYCGESGRAGRWRYSVLPSLDDASPDASPSSRPTASPAASPASPSTVSAPLLGEKPLVQPGVICTDIGSVLEVKDVQGSVAWRTARLVDARSGERLVHFHGWQNDYNEWISTNSDRMAACGTHTGGCSVAGFVEEVAYGPVWGSRGDTVGCLWDRQSGTVAFTRNGKYLGIAATDVWGVFAPAVSSENQAAGITMNFGGAPFMWSVAPSAVDALKTSGQAVPAAHSAALTALKATGTPLGGTQMLQKHVEAHAARVDDSTQAAAAINARGHNPSLPRPQPYSNWAVRNMARDLKEMLPPEASEAMVMRVLRLCGNDRGQAAEHLLQHMSDLMASSAQAASLEAADRDQVANFSFVELQYTSSGRTDRYVDHNIAAFGGNPPRAPGLTGTVVLAQPEYAQRELENASTVAGNIVAIRRGECTFVQKMERAQAAGATAVLLLNSQDSSMFVPDSGTDDTSGLHIPLALLTYEDGEDILASNLSESGLVVNMRLGLSAPPTPSPTEGAAQAEPQDGEVDTETKSQDDAQVMLDVAPRSHQAHSLGYSPSQGNVPVLGASHSSAAMQGVAAATESNMLRLPWSASADAVVGMSYTAADAAALSLRDSMGKLIPTAGVHGGGVMVDGLLMGDRPSGSATPSTQVSAQEQWISNVERSMSLRRVPAGVIAMVLDLLRQGGENQIAIARSMLEDVNIVLPPAPDADAPAGSSAGNASASPAMHPAASPFSGPQPPPFMRGRSSTGNVDSPGLPPMASPLQRSASSTGGSRVFNPAPASGWSGGATPLTFLPGQMVSVAVSREDVQLMRSQLVLSSASQLAAPPGSALGSLPQTPGTPARPLLHLPPFLEVHFQPAGSGSSTFVHGTIERHVPVADSGQEHVYDVVTDAGDAEANVSIDRLQVRDVKDRQVWVPARNLLGANQQKHPGPTVERPAPTALTGNSLRAAVTSLSSASLLLSPLDAVASEQKHGAWAARHDCLCSLRGRVLQVHPTRGAVQVAFAAEGTGQMLVRWMPSSQLSLCHQPVVTEALLGACPQGSRTAAEAARRECVRAAAAQLQLTLMQHFSSHDCEWGVHFMPTASTALFASSGWAPRSLALPEPSTPLGACTPALLTAAVKRPQLLKSMLQSVLDTFQAGTQRGLVLGGDKAATLSVQPCDRPITGWHVAVSVHNLSKAGNVEASPLREPLMAALTKAIPEGTVLCYRGVRSDNKPHEGPPEEAHREAAALHAVGRAADVIAFMTNEMHWVAASKQGNAALRSLGLPGGGTSGPRAHDAVAGALADLAAPVLLRCGSFDVEAVASSGAAVAAGAASLGVVATATPLPTQLPLVLALSTVLTHLVRQSSSPESILLACDMVPLLAAAARSPHTPSDVAAAMIDAAASLVCALPKPTQQQLQHTTLNPALEGIVADLSALRALPCDTASLVGSPLGALSAPEMLAAALESIKRSGSAGASVLHQAAARCAAAIAGPVTQEDSGGGSGLALCAAAAQALEWLAASDTSGCAPPTWLLQAAWNGPAWNALWRSLPSGTLPEKPSPLAVPAAATDTHPEIGEPDDSSSPQEDAAGAAASASRPAYSTQRRRAQVQGPAVASSPLEAVPLTQDNVLAAYAACGEWSVGMDKALSTWASQLAAAAARTAPDGSQAASDAAQLGLQLSVAAFTGRSSVPDVLTNVPHAVLFARYSLLAAITTLSAACMPLLCPDSTHPAVQAAAAAGDSSSGGYQLELSISSALPRLLGGVFNRWALHCISSTAAATTSIRPRIQLNRFSAGDPQSGMHSSIWAQTVRNLRWTMPHAMQLRQVRTAPHLAFEARLQGERVAGESGPYREVLDDCGRELAAHSAGGNMGFGMFQSTPNATGAYGEFRDCVMPSGLALLPSARPDQWVQGSARAAPLNTEEYFVGLGQLFAAAARTSAQVGVPFAPAVWQCVFGHLASSHALASVHAYLTENSLKYLRESSDPDTFDALFGDDLPSSTSLFEMGRSCEVLHVGQATGASLTTVQASESGSFATWLERTHIATMQLACSNIRRGFGSVVPLAAIGWLTSSDAAVMVAGVPDVDVDLLQRNTQYSGGATAQSMHIQQFWRVLREDFSPEQRQKFIKFAWGQSRLPANDAAFASNGTRLLIKSPGTPASDTSVDGRLPTADTCFFNVSLPPYSSYEAVRRQLTLVVSIGAGLDADAV